MRPTSSTLNTALCGLLAAAVPFALTACNGGNDQERANPSQISAVATDDSAASAGENPTEGSDSTDGSSEPASASSGADRDTVPEEYEEALASARNFTKWGGISEKKLYERLTYEDRPEGAREPYSPEAARYACDNVGVDWNEQALRVARTIREGMPISDDELYEVLVDEAHAFTPEQARYAIDHV